MQTGNFLFKSINPEICIKTYKDQTTLPVSVQDIVDWQNQTASVATIQNAMLTDLILTAREIIEKYCWLDLTAATYDALYDISPYGFFGVYSNNIRLTLPRAPILDIANITKIQYLDNTGAWVDFDNGTAASVPGIFLNSTMKLEQRQWSSIYFDNPPQFDGRINAYKIKVTFNTGFQFPSTGIIAMTYNNTTGLVTVLTAQPASIVDKSTVTITNATHNGYNGAYTVTVLTPSSFTYQLAPSLALLSDTGTYTYTTDGTKNMPRSLATCLKKIVAFNYVNRGDVFSGDLIDGYPVPPDTRTLLDMYSIPKSILGGGL